MNSSDRRIVERKYWDPIVRAIGRQLSPGGNAGRLSILIYHRVFPEADPLYPDEVDRDTFDWQMSLLSRCFNVLSLADAVKRLQDGTLPPHSVCVTFDDGYLDNHDVALPVLRKWNIPATFFVASGYLNGSCMWNDIIFETVRQANGQVLDLTSIGLGAYSIGSFSERRSAALALVSQLKYLEQNRRSETINRLVEAGGAVAPSNLMMQPRHVQAMSREGMDIGAHTHSHPILSRVSRETARAEIERGRDELQAMIGQRITLFAYPNGFPGSDYTSEHVQLVRDLGFSAAVSTAWGCALRKSDPYELPRFTPWDMTPARFSARLLHNYLRVAPVVTGK